MTTRRAALVATLGAAGIGGSLYGDPVMSIAFVAGVSIAWATAGFPGVLAVCVLTLALASSGYTEVKEAAGVQRWLALATLSVWPLVAGRQPRWRLPTSGYIAAGAFTILAFTSAWWSLDPSLTFSRAGTLMALLWVGLIVIPEELSQPHDRLAAARALAWTGAAGAIAALAVALVDPAVGRPVGPWQGWFENSNTLGLWCALLLPCTIALRRWPSKVVVAAPLVACVLASDSRSALFISAFVAFATLPFSLRARSAFAIGGAVVVTFLLISPAAGVLEVTGLGKFVERDDPVRTVTGAREEAWSATLDLVPFAPVEGFGFGLGDRVFALTGADLEFVHFVGNNPNNAYLNLLLELGVAGLLLVLLLLGSVTVAGWRMRSTPDRRPFFFLALAVLAAGTVESLFTAAGGPFAILLWTSVGVAGAAGGVRVPARRNPVVLVHATALRPAHDGGRTVVAALLAELPRVWPEARWLATVRNDVDVHAPGVELVRIRGRRGGALRVVDDLLRLPAFVGRLRPDVVLVPNESFALRTTAPVVVLAQNSVYHCAAVQPVANGSAAVRIRSRVQFAYHRWQMPRSYERADHVVAVSQHVTELLTQRAGLKRARVSVVHEGADGLALQPRESPPDGRTLLVVGTLAPYKRLDVALRALTRLRREDPAYRLVAAGAAWPQVDQELESLAADLGVADAWSWEGSCSSEGIAELLSTAHCLLALSACESFGLPVLEAMRAGLPVVAADEAWSRETASGAALLVPGDDADAVAAAVTSLNDPLRWRRLSEAGQERSEPFRWETTAQEIARVLTAVTSESRATARSPSDGRSRPTVVAPRALLRSALRPNRS